MNSSVIKNEGGEIGKGLDNLSISDQGEMQSKAENCEVGFGNHGGVCVICLNKTVLQETALVKGCEHAYCVTCILRWASYIQNPICPQCKLPFEFLYIHRSLDGSINDYMLEESVCLLLRAAWFKPLIVEKHEAVNEDPEDYYLYVDEEDDLDEVFFCSSSGVRIGNRRWGDNGYVRAGRKEARSVCHTGASSSRESKKEEVAKNTTGRRARRALKREAADKAAAAKHQPHLARLGRNLDPSCRHYTPNMKEIKNQLPKEKKMRRRKLEDDVVKAVIV